MASGKRISIHHTRALLNAALTGALLDVEYYTDPVFGFEVPKTCPGVPKNVLYPAEAWPNEEEYWKQVSPAGRALYRQLQEIRGGLPAGSCGSGAEIAGINRVLRRINRAPSGSGLLCFADRRASRPCKRARA